MSSTILLLLLIIIFSSSLSSVFAQNSDTNRCKTDCTKTYTSQTSCIADSSCFWSDFSDSCLVKCEYVFDRRACGGPSTEFLPDTTHCFWRNTTFRCEPKCSRLSSTDCGTFPHCETKSFSTLLSSSSSSSSSIRCVPRCFDISYTVIDDIPLTQLPLEVTRTTEELFNLCLDESDGECMLDVSRSLCVRSCTTEYGECLTEEQVRNCNNDRKCRFDARSGQCLERCDFFSNEVSCSMFGVYQGEKLLNDAGTDELSLSPSIRSSSLLLSTFHRQLQIITESLLVGGIIILVIVIIIAS